MTGIALPLYDLPASLLDTPAVQVRRYVREGREEVQFHWWQTPTFLPVRWCGRIQLVRWLSHPQFRAGCSEEARTSANARPGWRSRRDTITRPMVNMRRPGSQTPQQRQAGAGHRAVCPPGHGLPPPDRRPPLQEGRQARSRWRARTDSLRVGVAEMVVKLGGDPVIWRGECSSPATRVKCRGAGRSLRPACRAGSIGPPLCDGG